MNHLRTVTAYFPEGRETADKIDRIFADKPALQQALLSTMVTCLDPLLAQTADQIRIVSNWRLNSANRS